jgi:hypothetical protein
VGTIIGGLSMSVMSGASTYTVGQVAKGAFGSGNSLPVSTWTGPKRSTTRPSTKARSSSLRPRRRGRRTPTNHSPIWASSETRA